MMAEAVVSLDLPTFPVDAHVHFHREALVAPTLGAAADNFARTQRPSGPLIGALLLAQSSRERVFEALGRKRSAGEWRFSPAAEPHTLIAHSGDRALAVICGRQVRCTFGLEALALGTTADYPEGRGLEETVARIIADGALPVVPWGFGKWLGSAGRIVRRLFDSAGPGSLFAGDNGGRMELWGRPALLERAGRAGIRVLPGTDPFPFGGDHRRVGAFGFLAPSPDARAPFDGLRAWLGSGGMPVPYGRALGPLRFVWNQGGIQVYHRMGVAS